jgi:hypothetical protein
MSTTLHDATSQKTNIFILVAGRTVIPKAKAVPLHATKALGGEEV